MKKRVFLFNPPVGLYQRGEDRCQSNVEGSAAASLRACNDLGYMAAVLRKLDYEAKIADYPAQKENWIHFIEDFKAFNPSIAVMSITTATIEKDMKAFALAKSLNPDIITIAKGAHFQSCSVEELNEDIYRAMDYAISGEAEFIIKDLILALESKTDIAKVKGVFYRKEDKVFKIPGADFAENLDSLPFPARDLMDNGLYTRPDTGKPMATINVSRGCPYSCIYCLTPTVSGNKVRKRSAKNIADEIQECLEKYNIKDFFFKADTFTVDKIWIKEVCQEIISRNLKIQWGANSRVKPLEPETLKLMKEAGCWLIAFGIESGSDETLKKIKKDITVEDAKLAVRWAKEAKLKTFGYYLIGFPWEKKEDIKRTIKLAKELNCDYVEFHIVTPYEGTELYSQMQDSELLKQVLTGHDTFTNPVMGTNYLSSIELIQLKNRALKEIYLNPKYIIKTLKGIQSKEEILNYTKYALRMIKNIF